MKITEILTEDARSRVMPMIRVYADSMGNDFYPWFNEPGNKEFFAQRAGVTPEEAAKVVNSMDWGQLPDEFYAADDEDEDVRQGVSEGSDAVDINSIASQLRFLPTTKQAKRYRFVTNGQPGEMPTMSYTVSQQEQPVVTVTADGKETQNVATVNDIIMSGPSGENYVVKAAKFPKLYQGQVGQTVIPEQSPRQVAQYQGRDTVTFTAPWGESMVLKPGDYLVRDGDQGYYRIAQAEYRQTYNPPGR